MTTPDVSKSLTRSDLLRRRCTTSDLVQVLAVRIGLAVSELFRFKEVSCPILRDIGKPI